ncbi:MAG: NAD+ synthase [Pseudomonadota bacterium]
MKIQLSQLNFTVGDLDKNCQKILSFYQAAEQADVDLVVFSELAITGYPPEDLLHKKYFLDEIEQKIAEIKSATLGSKTAILLGAPILRKTDLNNSALLIENGEIIAIANKTCLPNYGVFDEHRYFKAAPTLTNFEFRGFRLAILVCEDIWHLKNAVILGDKVFDAIISINASPFTASKAQQRLEMVRKFIKNLKKPVIYVNQVGGQDSIIFDGGSFVINGDGEVVLQMKEFEEDTRIVSFNCHPECNEGSHEASSVLVHDVSNEILRCAQDDNETVWDDSKESKIYNATILGLRDYIHKNNFTKVLIGMSGGIDSALVAAIAVDALGSENVKLVALPTQYNSQTSMDDALLAAENLGVKLEVINIQDAVAAMNQALAEQFADTKKDTTEENIQSRIRGNILMALSNKFGNLLLSTGNKSELAVGYATIYGDMCGAFNPLKDIYKTEVFKLAKWRNKNIPAITVYKKTNLIPENIITKAPTAELRDNQKDSDSLPEYELLDKILFQLIEEEKSIEQIIEFGFEESLVKKVAKLFFNSEYKRKQAVIGVKVSEKSFDKDRRYPTTNNFKQ